MKCQCKPDGGCGFAASPGEPYHLTHDPRPERQEARRALMSNKGKLGGAPPKPSVKEVDLSTPNARLALLAEACKRLLNARKTDVASVANALVRCVQAADEISKTHDLKVENQELRQLIMERWPEAKRFLKSVS
jgi:hypothetical protein